MSLQKGGGGILEAEDMLGQVLAKSRVWDRRGRRPASRTRSLELPRQVPCSVQYPDNLHLFTGMEEEDQVAAMARCPQAFVYIVPHREALRAFGYLHHEPPPGLPEIPNLELVEP